MPPPTLLAQLPRVPDIPVERGRGAWARHRAKLIASGGQAGFHLAALVATRPSPPLPAEDADESAARHAKAALMSMSEALTDCADDDSDDGAVGSGWGPLQFDDGGVVGAAFTQVQRSKGACTADEVPVTAWSSTGQGPTPDDPQRAQSPSKAKRHGGEEDAAVAGSVHDRLAALPLPRGGDASPARRSRAGRRGSAGTPARSGRMDPVLAWGYSPAKRSGVSSPAGSSTSSISSGPSSPGGTERERGAGSDSDRRSPSPDKYDERVTMALFAGDEALAVGRHDTAIAKFEEALGHCKPRSAGFLKLQQRLVHARRVQSEVRRVVGDWLKTQDRQCGIAGATIAVARSVSTPVMGTSTAHVEHVMDGARRSALLQKRMEAAASSGVGAGVFSAGCIRPVARRGSPLQKVYRTHSQRQTLESPVAPFGLPKKDKAAIREIPSHSRDKAFPARMPGAAVFSRTATRRPTHAGSMP
jgi:hypothetical protein